MKPGMRGSGVNLPANPEKIGLPLRPFMYTLDQIATMLNVEVLQVQRGYIYYEGRTTGVRARSFMIARDIAPEGSAPEWRVAEREFIRWCKFKGFRVYERGAVSS